MGLSKRSMAQALVVLQLTGCATVVSELAVRNAPSQGGTGEDYRIARTFGWLRGRSPYVDRSDTFLRPIPLSAHGATLIRVADGDKDAAPGSSKFMSFVVNQSARVYVAHDTRITLKPAWLRNSFLDTGKQMRIGSTSLELYSNVYPSHTSVILGSNLAAEGGGRNAMYSVIIVPTARDLEPPTAPASLQVSCATAAVVGLRWTASTDDIKVAGYRIMRDGATIATTPNAFFSDTAVAASTQYTYIVTAFDAAGNTTDSAPLTITTSPASIHGDAPVCPSTVIGSVTWNWPDAYTQANGSDLWPVTWGIDGNVYAIFGDGGGFGGDDHRGRASFGVAMLSDGPPPTATGAKNIYGGYQSEHPSLLSGKASSIIAIGPDFYAIAGIYGTTDSTAEYPDQPWSAPNHVEIAYSIGNAYSWQRAPWIFCAADASGKKDLSGAFCPMGFVNFGAGNSGAPDGYVYMYGNDPATRWDEGPRTPPALTYLARVPRAHLLTQSAYEFFAGLDADGAALWSADPNRMMPVFTDRNADQTGCGAVCNMTSKLEEAFYNPALNRYIGVAQGDYVGQTSIYDAPTPWGPWTVVSYNNIDAATGEGGWAHLGSAGGSYLGVHAVNAWTSSSGKTLWMTYSAGGKAPPGALFPPAGTSMDSFNLVSVELNLAAAP